MPVSASRRRAAGSYEDPILVEDLRTDADWRRLRVRYETGRPSEPIANPQPWRRCLDVARASGAVSLVVERQYHCKDYRSEYVSSYAHQLYPPNPDAHRLHFFGSRVDRDDLTNLASRRYLGYVVCRPPSLPIVGRTMLVPPPELRTAVRTWSRETVHLFGQPLPILAAPFMQQDNQVDICAHVCAWMVHFSMFLRERELAREVIAGFPIRSGAFSNPARPVQGDGVSALDAERLLAATGLPTQQIECLVGDGVEPLDPLPYPWGPARPWEAPGAADSDALARRSLGELACRYLNSGYPLYVHTGGHSVVVCGYEAADADLHVSYVGHDDSAGPYIRLEDPRGTPRDQWEWLLCPLPEQIALTPRAAENVALARFKQAADWIGDEVAETGGLGAESWGYQAVADLMRRGRLKRRTYLIQANEWKRDLPSRMTSKRLRAIYSELSMSRHIAVTEFVDRTRPGSTPELVRGEVVLDATASEHNYRLLALRLGNVVTFAPARSETRTVVVPALRVLSGARGRDVWG